MLIRVMELVTVSFLCPFFFVIISLIIRMCMRGKNNHLNSGQFQPPLPNKPPQGVSSEFSDENMVAIYLNLSLDGQSYTASVPNIGGKHLNLKNHQNLIKILEMIVESEKERHEFIKKFEKNKFKLLLFKKDEPIQE